MIAVINLRRQRSVRLPKELDDDDDFTEPDPEEQELRNFENHCRLLDTAKFSGLEWVQVNTWLLFEDSASSRAANVVQSTLLVLILISTSLILIESHVMHPCSYECELLPLSECQPGVRRCEPPQPLPLLLQLVKVVATEFHSLLHRAVAQAIVHHHHHRHLQQLL